MARGRPRKFDPEQALDIALSLFWKHGYEGTSLAMLAKEMGINMPSLYAHFGNKEQLFQKTVDRYIQRPASYLMLALQQPTARQAAEKAFAGAIDMVMDPRNPEGCLLVQGALACGPVAEPVRQELAKRRAGAEAAVYQRFQRAVEEGDLPPQTDARQLARFLITVIWGMSVQAAGGASRAELEQIASTAMLCWPTST